MESKVPAELGLFPGKHSSSFSPSLLLNHRRRLQVRLPRKDTKVGPGCDQVCDEMFFPRRDRPLVGKVNRKMRGRCQPRPNSRAMEKEGVFESASFSPCAARLSEETLKKKVRSIIFKKKSKDQMDTLSPRVIAAVKKSVQSVITPLAEARLLLSPIPPILLSSKDGKRLQKMKWTFLSQFTHT